jgi:hypothetical protein
MIEINMSNPNSLVIDFKKLIASKAWTKSLQGTCRAAFPGRRYVSDEDNMASGVISMGKPVEATVCVEFTLNMDNEVCDLSVDSKVFPELGMGPPWNVPCSDSDEYLAETELCKIALNPRARRYPFIGQVEGPPETVEPSWAKHFIGETWSAKHAAANGWACGDSERYPKPDSGQLWINMFYPPPCKSCKQDAIVNIVLGITVEDEIVTDVFYDLIIDGYSNKMDLFPRDEIQAVTMVNSCITANVFEELCDIFRVGLLS